MEVILAETSGFCFGVQKSVDAARQLIKDHIDEQDCPLYMYGHLIHNQIVVDELLNQGMRLAESIDEIPDGACVIIRAHGVPPEVLDQLAAKNCRIVNQTCPFVNKIHRIVRQASLDGARIIIAGSPTHPEVVGINGECERRGLVVSSALQARALTFLAEKHVLVAQTTFSTAEYKEIREVLKKKIAKLQIFDTICITTEKRQEEAKAIADRVDMMFVLGSTSSSNTQKLLDVCSSRCGETHLIEYPEQVSSLLADRETDTMTIGVIAGASTPERIIREVIHAMTDNEVMQNQQEQGQEKEKVLEQEQVQEQVQENVQEPAQEPAQEQAEEQVQEPAQEQAEEQVQEPAQEQAEEQAEEQVQESAQEATPEQAEEQVEEPVQEAAQEQAEEQVQEAVQEQAEEQAEEPVQEPAQDEEAASADEKPEDENAQAEAVQTKTAEAAGDESAEEPADISFTDFIDNIPQLKRGATVKGVIVRYDNDHVYVDVKDKSEGKIPRHEFDGDPDFDLDTAIAEHTEIDVYVRNIRNSDFGKEIILSKARVDFGKYKGLIEDAFNDKTPISVKVVNVVKDGVIASYGGVDIYVHRTQLEMGIVEDLEPYRGQTLDILVTQFDPDKKRLRVSGSRRALLSNERKKKADELWDSIQAGNKYQGIVRSLTDFGAFVDIGGVDGLVHVSELSWKRIRHPSDVVSVGDEIEVYVKDFDRDRKRISLGYKKVEDDPYHDVESRFPVGSIVRGIVVRMFPFGAFVEIAPGVDALCHISQIANVRLSKPNDVLSEGMEIDARVLEVSNESRRISISIKEVEPINPEGYEESETSSSSDASGFNNQSELDKF